MNRKFLYFFISLFLQISLFGGNTFASVSKNFYIVKGIPVHSSSFSSSQAKKLSLEKARTEAFNNVLSRLLLSEDLQNVIIPDTYNMEKFVKSLKLTNEKTTSTSYSANVDIELNKNLIESYLDNQGFEFLKDLPPSTLIIIRDIYGVQTGIHSAIKQYDDKSNVVKFTIANENDTIPSFSGQSQKNLSQLTELSDSDFDYLRSKYNVENVILADFPTYYTNYDIAFFDKLLGIKKEVIFNNTSEESEEESENTCSSECMVKNFFNALNDAYKEKMFETDISQNISLIVPIYSLADWLDLQKKFSTLSVFKDMTVQALKHNKAQLKIKYNYDLNSVIASLSSLGFGIEEKDGYLLIKR